MLLGGLYTFPNISDLYWNWTQLVCNVGRKYVPLFDVDTDLRYYVIRDVIVL